MDLIDKTIIFVKDVFQNDFSGHDYAHTERVYKLALKIAEKEKADFMIVSLAALLHDVDDYKLSSETYQKKDRTVQFLREQEVDEKIIQKIVEIIEEVSFVGTDSKVPSSLEGKIVQDADRLDAIGAIGIARCFTFGGSHHRVLYDPNQKPSLGMNEKEYRNHVSTTINHFYEKLFLLKDMMNTETAKQIAIKRDAYMHAFIDEFLDEWDGNS